MMNEANLRAFNLQQMGVEALVERRALYLEGSRVPELQPMGDTFERRGHIYPAKQPGQLLLGAMAYALLHAVGISYAKNYVLAAALVTFLSAALVTAVGALECGSVAAALNAAAKPPHSIAATLTYAFATTATVYSGIAHHDLIATSLLVIAFALLHRGGRGSAIAAGVLLGFAITTSMLVVPLAVILILYSRERLWTLAGTLVGLLPLLVYDAIAFGNPLLVPNLAGEYDETYLRLDLQNFAEKVVFYARLLLQYVPFAPLGILGLANLPRRERLAAFAMLAVLFLQVTNIRTTGDCQYGPRYLLPAMPLLALGVTQLQARWLRILAVLAVTASAVINVAGALRSAMWCDPGTFAFLRSDMPSHPLAPILFLSLLTVAVALLRRQRSTCHNSCA